jgi:hypothetical protein
MLMAVKVLEDVLVPTGANASPAVADDGQEFMSRLQQPTAACMYPQSLQWQHLLLREHVARILIPGR